MKFLQTIRFDPSDMNVFPIAADPDEWAIAGGFYFSGARDGDLKGKEKQAFSNGFLSVTSFGFSTFTSVCDIKQDELDALESGLANWFVQFLGAPDMDSAREVARQEILFVVDMCRDVPVNTVFALGRYFDETGEIREEFRIVEPPSEPLHARVWEIVE